MPTWGWIVIAVAIVLLVAMVAWLLTRARRTRTLRERFGPEYDRTVRDTGGRRGAESELVERERRRERLSIRPLDPVARQRHDAS